MNQNRKPKKKKGVYETFHQNLNPIYVPCSNCIYCYMIPLIKRVPDKFELGFFIKRLEAKRNMKNKTFFIETNCDIFNKNVPNKWIWDTIRYIDKYYDKSNTYCMLTKFPERYLDFIDFIPKDWLLGLTLETNYKELIRMYSKAPLPHERYKSMQKVREQHKNIYVMVEPILDFDRGFFYNLLISLDAKYYLFGANSLKSIKLKEPNSDKLRTLINKLKMQNKIVIIKDNMKRLGIETKIGYLKKNLSDFRFETEEKPELTTLEKYMEI